MFGSDIGCPGLLHHLTQTLPRLMSVRLDLVVMWSTGALLDGLDLGAHLGSLAEYFGEFFFQSSLLRVHAISRWELPD